MAGRHELAYSFAARTQRQLQHLATAFLTKNAPSPDFTCVPATEQKREWKALAGTASKTRVDRKVASCPSENSRLCAATVPTAAARARARRGTGAAAHEHGQQNTVEAES